MWHFYILKSLTTADYFYKGVTKNLKRRLSQHNSGQVKSTAPYRPFALVYIETYVNEAAAKKREASVKKNGNVSVPLLRRVKESLEEPVE